MLRVFVILPNVIRLQSLLMSICGQLTINCFDLITKSMSCSFSLQEELDTYMCFESLIHAAFVHTTMHNERQRLKTCKVALTDLVDKGNPDTEIHMK